MSRSNSTTPGAVSAPQAPIPVEVAWLPSPPAEVTWSPAHLTVVQVRSSPDPLIDTMPHPVVKMFPLPVAEPVRVGVGHGIGAMAEAAVFADLDGEREARRTAELVDGAAGAAARRNNGAYHGRHSA